ncbi:5-formyltetrahydrofolate cyclo-ligase [Aliiglaciecola sp. CAU 1673]|uniref:5-formyltetrahydrofolate cyclo-ligase n=1 Tax=Aliiglaciecola sp. CAU 1673 TaxID=3032595 RepID=UPI0023D9FBBA|nr:5-formyltetrahydrofolate cyclo-ligase [Aliiglaciecola sp. CAU 1673]MDF2179461.1 5-formyltetrahydrofolate cyclo-ligase [Aliiglaciecola sp. CAU 1673]
MTPVNSQTLRQSFRQKRRSLDHQAQTQAAFEASNLCLTLAQVKQAKRIAFYLANDGELDPAPLIHRCWELQKEVYLPVLHPFSQGYLMFVRYTADTPMAANRFGIAEPQIETQSICPLAELELIFTPLVAFDAKGNRMGMGGGFYDRTLAPIYRDKLKTQVIGLAHDCQLAVDLPVQPWDIPLHGVVTPSRFYSFCAATSGTLSPSEHNRCNSHESK